MAHLVTHDDIMIPTTDEVLDQVRARIESQDGTQGFWLATLPIREVDGVQVHPRPEDGHELIWIPKSAIVSLIYDRPLHADPDRIEDQPGTIWI